MEIKELVDKIQTTWEAMKAKNDEVLAEAKKTGEGRAEDKAAWEKMNTALDAQKKQLDDIALKVERASLVKPGAPGKSEEDRAYDAAFYKWMRGGSKNMGSDDFKALKNALPAERKALIENAAGLYLVPEDLEAEIMQAVPQINTLRSVCRVRPTNRDKVGINSATALSVGWGKLELGSTPTESTQTISRDTIYAEDLLGLTKVGVDELEDTDANLAALLAGAFSVAIADEEAKRFAIGRGHTTYQEPDGITLESISHTNWTTGDTILINDMLTCEYSLGAQYLNGARWLMHRTTELAARKLRAEVASGYYGNYLWQPSLLAGQPNNFDGFPILNQNDMATSAGTTDLISVVFGNFNLGYMIVDRKGIAIQRLDELYAEAGMVGFIAKKRVGGGAYRTAAFYGIGNANT
ncbi:MAG: phage major capsid protein [Spirochaetota bacterium]